jgi:hypothetical protein
VRHHTGDLVTEAPLILDPAGLQDPRDHIHFKDEVAVGATLEGETTVDYCGLNRLSLIEARLEHFKMLDMLRKVTTLPTDTAAQQAVRNEAEAFLAQAVLPTAKFSAMAQDMLEA